MDATCDSTSLKNITKHKAKRAWCGGIFCFTRELGVGKGLGGMRKPKEFSPDFRFEGKNTRGWSSRLPIRLIACLPSWLTPSSHGDPSGTVPVPLNKGAPRELITDVVSPPVHACYAH